MENIKDIIESLLFVSETPLTIDGIKKAIPEAQTPEIRDAITRLSTDYAARKGGFYLNEVAGGYQLRTRAEFNEWIKRLLQPKPARLSRAALETLAIIAYKQPIIRSDIEHIRGVDTGGVLRILLERKLIRILGRKKIPGRPLIYGTTKLFLEVFDLKDLRELPTPKEIEALEEEAADGSEEFNNQDTDPNQMQLFEDNGDTAEESADDASEPHTEESTATVESDDTANTEASDDAVEALPDVALDSANEAVSSEDTDEAQINDSNNDEEKIPPNGEL